MSGRKHVRARTMRYNETCRNLLADAVLPHLGWASTLLSRQRVRQVLAGILNDQGLYGR